jgi:hypothetical protein
MESNEKSLIDLVKKLSAIIKDKRKNPQPNQANVEWTKIALIVPLLEGLGWDKCTDITYEFGPPGSSEVRLDLILKGQSRIGIETRTLFELPPQNLGHPQINSGLLQCKAISAPYFIWTNGDYWQFFSLALANAPLYQVCLSKIEDDHSFLEKLLIIKKDAFISHPEKFNKALSEKLKEAALPHAWTAVLQDHTTELLQVFRKGLQQIEVKDEAILRYLRTFKPEGLKHQTRPASWTPKPKNWEQLIESYESPYRLARWFFRTSYYRKLGEYLINENYKPWSKDLTWKHIDLPESSNVRKKVEHAVVLFREWGFIKESGEKYCRVEECVPYLKKLLSDNTSN